MKSVTKWAIVITAAVWTGMAMAVDSYSWNVGSATWDLSSPNWTGAGTVWVDSNDAVFNNTASATTVTISGARTAGVVRVGNGGNNAYYTFANGAGGSLAASSFLVQGSSNNGPGEGPAILDNLTLNTSGDLGIGRWMLVIKGTSVVNVGGKITWNTAGISSPDWGALTIQDSAAVTADLGVDCYDHVWDIALNGGSLTTPFLRAIDGNWGKDVHLTFNGGTLVASASNADFLQINGNGQAWVNSGGAIIDSGAYDIAINSKLIHDASGPATDGGLTKLGSGTLTLSGVNTYNGTTTVNAGTLAINWNTALPSDTVLSVASGASMSLNFNGTNTVNSLTLNGVLRQPGIWGAVGSGARYTSEQFSGTGVLRVLNGATSSYSWNVGNGDWDTSTANWTGTGSIWVDDEISDAIFANSANAAAITLSSARTARSIKVGNDSNNASYTFSSGAGGSLDALSFLVQGSNGNGPGAGISSPTVLNNLKLNTSGNLGVGRWTLVIGGSSEINVGGTIGGGGIVSAPDWATLTIQDSAVVTAANGVNGNAEAWSLNLNGGTLVTKSIQASDREGGGDARLTFNGTTVKPTQANSNFVTVGANNGSTSSALIGNGGAVFDTDDKNIGVAINLRTGGSGGLAKLGSGTLTLSGENTYTGGTTVNGGTLRTPVPSSVGPGVVTVASGATWDLGLGGHAVAGLSGAGSVTRASGGMVTTGIDGAAQISTSKNYIQLLDFGNAGGATVNGVTFSGVDTSGPGWSLDAGGLYAHDSGSGYDQLMSDFRAGAADGVTGMLTFDNLSSGQVYTAVIYTKVGSWGGRPQNATFVNGTDIQQLLNTDPGNVGYYAYWFKAIDTTATISMAPLTVNTFHWFGASLELVTNAMDLVIGAENDHAFSGAIGGMTALVKRGSGKQTLSGANTYSGATTISEGTLEITAADALPAGTALEIATGATLKLGNPSEQSVSTLTFNGVPQYRGTWGAIGSGAQFERAQFSGTGILRVINGENAPGTMIKIF